MKRNAGYRAIALIIAVMMLLGITATFTDVSVNASVVNYAKGASYVTTGASYLTGKDDNNHTLLTDGVIGTIEASGTTVSFAGSKSYYTIVFDLGEIKYDIKTIKFMNVLISGNRDFGADEVTIAVSKENSGTPSANTYTYDSVVQYGTEYFNYTYELSTEAIGRYVTVKMYSPNYVISLSEIEIWGSGNPAVDDGDDTPKVINYASGISYTASGVAYKSGMEDNGKLLTDGVVASMETNGVTVAYEGTNKTYTLIFDLGSTKDDIKTVKFRNVCVSGNRNFSADKVVIAATDSLNSAEVSGAKYTYVKEVQSGSTYFDFTYTLDSQISGRYVYVTMHTSGYILSLSEIEIYSAPQSGSSIVIPDPIDTTPKFDISIAAPSQFKKGQTIEVQCTVKNITATYGIVAVDFIVNYNIGAFTPVYPSGDDLSSQYIKKAPMNGSTMLWEDIGTYCDTKNGAIYMRFAHKTAENGDGTKNDGELVFKIHFKANLSSGTYNFEATNCRGTDPGSSNNKKLTEVYANGSTCSSTAAAITYTLVPIVSGVTVENGYIFGIPAGKTSSEVAAMFEGNVTVASNGNDKRVGTGYTVTAEGGGERATVVVKGDMDGNGALDSTDYMAIKKCIMGEATFDPMYLLAADINDSGKIDTTDYVNVKSHFLGINNIYQQ